MTVKRLSRGFTLVEVVFAIAILSLCLTAAFRAYLLGMDAIVSADGHSRAVILAGELMDQLGDIAPAAGQSAEGEFEEHPEVTWSLTSVPVEWEGQPLPGLVETNVTIFWPGRRSRKTSLSFSVYLRRN